LGVESREKEGWERGWKLEGIDASEKKTRKSEDARSLSSNPFLPLFVLFSPLFEAPSSPSHHDVACTQVSPCPLYLPLRLSSSTLNSPCLPDRLNLSRTPSRSRSALPPRLLPPKSQRTRTRTEIITTRRLQLLLQRGTQVRPPRGRSLSSHSKGRRRGKGETMDVAERFFPPRPFTSSSLSFSRAHVLTLFPLSLPLSVLQLSNPPPSPTLPTPPPPPHTLLLLPLLPPANLTTRTLPTMFTCRPIKEHHPQPRHLRLRVN